MDDAFAGYHPAIGFLFFMGAIVMGMFFAHPAFLCVSIAASALYYLLLMGKKGIRLLCSMLALFIAISLINPLFNPLGDTVLFAYIGGRSFTLEALLYGCATGGMFLSVLLWFACYNRVMTSDKFIYLFGRCIPAVSLLLTMVLRLVPHFKAKAAAIAGARKCVGKAPESGTRKEKLLSGTDALSVLISWALEGAVVTADSMKSRGYGSGKRSNFSVCRLCARDGIALGVMLAGLALVMAGAVWGGADISYYPVVTLPQAGSGTAVGATGYSVFLLMPSVIHIGEDVIWHISRSRI
jgi:energy-coupling factor transport system permease protein